MARALVLIALLALVSAVSSVEADIVGPTSTTPAGGAEGWSGHPGYGTGLTISGSGHDLTKVSTLYFGFDANGFAFGLDGYLHQVAFNAGASDLPNGYARFDGSSPTLLQNYSGTDPTVNLRSEIWVTAAGTSTPLALSAGSSIPGLTGSTGVVLDVASDFDVSVKTSAYWPGGYNQTVSAGWYLYGSLYDQLDTPPEVNGTVVNVGTVYWYTPIPADANGDGVVDGADAATLANHWGTSVSGGSADGDFNGDGVVNAADASILAANWSHGGSESIVVPEPGSVVMLVLGALGLLAFARRRRR